MKSEGWTYAGKSPTAYCLTDDGQAIPATATSGWYVWQKSEFGKTKYVITLNALDVEKPISDCYNSMFDVSEGDYYLTEYGSGKRMHFKYKYKPYNITFYLEL